MAQKDKEKWDSKHLTAPIPNTPIDLIINYAKLAKGKQALDIACGMGRHSKYLASEGFEVDALDISSTAIESLQGLENINAKEVDFDTYTLEENKYDLIVCTYFLERSLFPQIEKALRVGGIFIYETYLYHPDNSKIPSNRTFLLEVGELELAFNDRFDLIHLQEWWDEDYDGSKTMKASMVAQKKVVDE
ncbi:methyltransferase domain-containing protein [Sulfurovum sp.]|uniref:class I SAM-dependent methyltransferase n=1 Tax=Sulfurovum sp. TaxID=1969726 RepID=UPI002868375E|nr:methyltransferase domain-containing protein [Sulfurovum sp.]